MKIAALILMIFAFSSCQTTKVEQAETEPINTLNVGVTPDYPPVIFKQGGEIAGIEADLARLLAAELGRPLKFVEVQWEAQIPSLLERKTDIIMSGMSITKARKIRVSFTDYYMRSGLAALMHIDDTGKFNSVDSIMHGFLDVGVVGGTTSEIFVRKNFTDTRRIITFQKANDVPTSLKNRSIDIFVHDVPSIMWLLSENEADLAALRQPLNEEMLAWGVRKDKEGLLSQVAPILSRWKKDGTLDRIILKWLPPQYLERFR
jgi:polar amino acid transport system substrate-binding protein